MMAAVNARAMEPSIVHSIVDAFFEVKKVEVKQRLQLEMDRVVEDMFGQLVTQVKQLLLPSSQSQVSKQDTFLPFASQPQIESGPIKSPSVQKSVTTTSTGKFNAVKSVPFGHKRSSPPTIKRPFVQAQPKSDTKVNNGHCIENNCPSGHSDVEQKTSNCSEKNLLAKVDNNSTEILGTSSIGISYATEENVFCPIAPVNQIISNKSPKRVRSDSNNNNNCRKKVKVVEDVSQQNHSKPAGKFICSFAQCGKSFDRTFVLKRHERIHQNLKPYRCRWSGCLYASANQSDTIRHIQSVHLGGNSSKQTEQEDQQAKQVDPKLYLEVDKQVLK